MSGARRNPITIHRYFNGIAAGACLLAALLAGLAAFGSGAVGRLAGEPSKRLAAEAGLAASAFQLGIARIEAVTELVAASGRPYDRAASASDPGPALDELFRGRGDALAFLAGLEGAEGAAIVVDEESPDALNALALERGGKPVRENRPFPREKAAQAPGWFEDDDGSGKLRLSYYAVFPGGAVAVSCGAATMASLLSGLRPPAEGSLVLADRYGALIARAGGGVPDGDAGRLAIMALPDPEGAAAYSVGERGYFASRADLPSGLRLVAILPYWAYRRPVIAAGAAFGFLLLSLLGLGLLASYLVARYIARPIDSLSSGALLAFSGMPGKLPVDEGPLEVRLLAKALGKAIADLEEKASQQKLLMESDARIDLLSIDLSRERISSLNGFRLFGVEGKSDEMDFREWVEHFHIVALEKNYNPLLSTSYQDRSGREQNPADMLAGFLEMRPGENRQSEFTFDTLKGEEGFLRVNMVRPARGVVLAACVDLTEEFRTRRELFVLSTRLSYALNATQSVAIFDVSFETMELWASESFFPIFEVEMPPAGTLILPGFEKRLAEGDPPLLDPREGLAPSDLWKKGTRVIKLNLPRSGASRWIEVRTAETVRGIIGTVIDITREVLEKQAAQEKADTAQELSRVILTALTEAVVGMGREGHCVFLNPAAEALLGFQQAELVGQDLRQIFAPVDATGRRLDGRPGPIERALGAHAPVTSDYERFRRKDGSFYQASIRVQPLFKAGEFIGAVASLVDVSALVELSNRFGAMLANAVDQIYMTDRALRVTMVSDSILKARQAADATAILGKSATEVFPFEDAREFRAREEEVLSSGRPVRDLVMRLAPADAPRWLDFAIIPLRDAQGEVIGEFGIARDVTESNRLEEELRAAKIEAERANQAKSIFLAGMSHEIRTPLNAILGYSQLIADRPGLGSEERRMADTIMRSGEHLLDLINSILEISKIEAGRLSPFLAAADLFRLLEDIESMFRIRTEAKGLSFEVRRDEAVPRWIVTDVQKLRQILINLLGNAVKFTDKGGVALRAFALAGMLVLEVRDTGPGISDEEKERLFAPFTQGKAGIDSQGGTGLGLAISREYARLLGGNLSAVDAEGGGSLFRCEVALAEAAGSEASLPATRRTVAGLADPAGAPLVLNVDDSEPNRTLVRDMLEPLGFRLMDARDGREAIGALEIGEPDVVLMDIIMPDMDGIEAIEKIRAGKRLADVPIIALTASAFEEDRRRVMAAGANDFIRKPVEREPLLEKIGRATGVRYRYNEVEAPRQADAGQGRPLDLAKVPEELLRELRKAAVELAPFQAAEVVKAIGRTDPAAAAELSRLIERFDFQSVIGLIAEREKHNG